MAPSRTSGAGNALGLTSTKSRAASVRASGKREQLKKAEGLPSIHIDDPRFDGIWQRTRKTMGMQPSTYISWETMRRN